MSEFAHRLTLDRIRDGDRLDLVADAEERAAVAARLDLASLDRLDAHAVLRREGDAILASGRVKATLEQRCVATGDALAVRVDEAFDLKFVPGRSVTKDEINEALKAAAASNALRGILVTSEDPLVSSDLNHIAASSTAALPQTQVIEGQLARVLSWYDNEWGFATRMSDTAVAMAKLI